jgi:hypothetical protein
MAGCLRACIAAAVTGRLDRGELPTNDPIFVRVGKLDQLI